MSAERGRPTSETARRGFGTGRRSSVPSAARAAVVGGPLATVLAVVGGVGHFGAPLPETVAIIAVVLAFLLSIAHLGRLVRRDGQAHEEAMRALDVRETEVRCRAVVDSGDRRWTDEELRLLLAAERERSTQDERIVPPPRAAGPAAVRPASRHRAG